MSNRLRQTNLLKIAYFVALSLIWIVGAIPGALAQDTGQTEPAGRPVVTMNRVESQRFPTVTAHLAVTDAEGLPLVGLSSPNFLIFEDNTPVPAEAIVAETVLEQELRLVLAFDLSTPAPALADMQAASKALLAEFTPRDRTAVLEFADEVEVGYVFTNNQNELRDVIDNLEPGGNSTALNDALLQAIQMADEQPRGHKAVVVMTDRTDNSSSAALEEVIAQAQAAGVLIYPIGYGPKVSADLLNQLARQTGGQAVILPNTRTLKSELLTLGILLRQSYRVTFQSGLQADNSPHNLSVSVVHQQQESQPAQASFVAVPADISVLLPALSPGQTVEDTVMLDPQIVASAPVASVTYLLDGEPLAQLDEAPYSYRWNSTSAGPGAHTLAVQVTDRAGNEGQTEIELNVNVPTELIVTVSTLKQEVELGSMVDIRAGVNPRQDVTDVKFLMGDTLLGSDTDSPYSISFDSSQYEAGEHTLTVRAEDRFGQSGEATLELQFIEPGGGGFLAFFSSVPGLSSLGQRVGIEGDLGQSWPRLAARTAVIVLGLALVIAIFLIALALLRRIWASRQHDYERRSQLDISNLGNVRSRYRLRAEDKSGALRFRFIPPEEVAEMMPATQPVPQYAGAPQMAPVAAGAAPQMSYGGQPRVPGEAYPPQQQPYRGQQPSSGAPQPQQQQAGYQQPQQQAASGGQPARPQQPQRQQESESKRPDLSEAAGKASGMVAIAMTVADILGTVASFLPGGLGAPIRRTSASLRRYGTSASQAVDRPRQMVASAQHARDRAGSLVPDRAGDGDDTRQQQQQPARQQQPQQPPAPTGPTRQPPSQAQTVAAGQQPRPQPQVHYQPPAPGGSPQPQPARPPAKKQKATGIIPGKPNQLETPFIAPGDSLSVELIITPANPNQTQDCSFKVTSTSLEQAGAGPVVQAGQIHIEGVPLFKRVLPYISLLVVAVVALLLVGYIIYFMINVDVSTLPLVGEYVQAGLGVEGPGATLKIFAAPKLLG